MDAILTRDFEPGMQVVYGIHGRCLVESVVHREIGGEKILFYKLQVQKPTLSRSKKNEPAIWLPVTAARSRGLRAPMTREQASQAVDLLSNREFYFPLECTWNEVQPALEETIANEGGLGMAKVVAYLAVQKRHQVGLPPDISRFYEVVHRQLVRELSEITENSIRSFEELIEKGVTQKLRPSN